jgi:hypothetical protein
MLDSDCTQSVLGWTERTIEDFVGTTGFRLCGIFGIPVPDTDGVVVVVRTGGEEVAVLTEG